jgi:hypothetical protein
MIMEPVPALLHTPTGHHSANPHNPGTCNRPAAEERAALLSGGDPYFPPRRGGDRLGLVLRDSTDWQEVRELVIESYCRLAPKKLSAVLDTPTPPEE